MFYCVYGQVSDIWFAAINDMQKEKKSSLDLELMSLFHIFATSNN